MIRVKVYRNVPVIIARSIRGGSTRLRHGFVSEIENSSNILEFSEIYEKLNNLLRFTCFIINFCWENTLIRLKVIILDFFNYKDKMVSNFIINYDFYAHFN